MTTVRYFREWPNGQRIERSFRAPALIAVPLMRVAAAFVRLTSK